MTTTRHHTHALASRLALNTNTRMMMASSSSNSSRPMSMKGGADGNITRRRPLNGFGATATMMNAFHICAHYPRITTTPQKYASLLCFCCTMPSHSKSIFPSNPHTEAADSSFAKLLAYCAQQIQSAAAVDDAHKTPRPTNARAAKNNNLLPKRRRRRQRQNV